MSDIRNPINAQIYKPSALIFSTQKFDFLIIHVFLLVGEIFYPIGAIENLLFVGNILLPGL